MHDREVDWTKSWVWRLLTLGFSSFNHRKGIERNFLGVNVLRETTERNDFEIVFVQVSHVFFKSFERGMDPGMFSFGDTMDLNDRNFSLTGQ